MFVYETPAAAAAARLTFGPHVSPPLGGVCTRAFTSLSPGRGGAGVLGARHGAMPAEKFCFRGAVSRKLGS